MSRDYPPLKRKKQKIKDAREWVVAKYSYIYAIVIFAVAVLCLIDTEVGLFMMPVFSLIGVLFLIAAINCRVTMNTEQITVRNFFHISKTYSFSEIESWRENTHYVYLYPVKGRRICVRRDDEVDGGLGDLSLQLKKRNIKEREGVSDSKLYWGNCSRPISQTMALIAAAFVALFSSMLIMSELATVSTRKEDLKSHTFTVTEVREVEDGFELYDKDTFYYVKDTELIEGRKPSDLAGTKVSVLTDEINTVWELTDRYRVSWYTFEEYEGYLGNDTLSIIIFIGLFGVASIAALTYFVLVLLAYYAPHKHPRMYEYFETTNIGRKGSVSTFIGLPPQKGNL